MEAGARLRHHALRHPGDGHGARRSRPVHARRRLHRREPRLDRRPEVVALRDGPRLDREPRQAGLLRRPPRARARAPRRLGVEAASASRSTGRASSDCTPRSACRRRFPAMAVRGSLPVYAGRQAGRLRVDQHLVAGAEEVPRARAPAAAALRAGHAASRSRSRSSTTPPGAGARWSRCRSTSPSGRRSELASQSYDAIVIGGGHNGLIAAAYLARAGKKVRRARAARQSSAARRSPRRSSRASSSPSSRTW